MKTQLLFAIPTLLSLLLSFLANDASISGTVKTDYGDPVIYGNVLLYQNGVGLDTALTDFEGNYTFKKVKAGTYEVEVLYTGYTPNRRKGILVEAGKTTRVDFIMSVGVLLDEVIVTGYHAPVVKRNMSASVPQIQIEGSNSTNYYIDAVRKISSGEEIALQYKSEQQYFSREGYQLIQDNPFLKTDQEPLSTFSVDVDRASYSNVRRHIQDGQRPPADAVRIEEMINYFDYAYAQPTEAPFSIYTEMHTCPWNADHKLLHIGLQGKSLQPDVIPPSNLVFLLDVSGSMNEPNKLPLVISSFKILVEKLRPEDRIAIAVYAGSSGLVLPGTSGADKKTIIAALDRLRAGGSTAGAAGITLAYETARANFIPNGNNRVILATDGDFNVGVSSDGELVRLIEKERASGIFLTVLGFGMGNYQDSKMQQLADHGNGNHAYIDGILEAKKIFEHEFTGTLFTIAKDVKIQIEFNPLFVQSYRLIGYENRLLAAEDFNDDKKDAGEIGAGHTVTALYEIIPAGVHDPYARNVDPLKYQKRGSVQRGEKEEWLNIKFRYKHPDENESKLLSHAVLEAKNTDSVESDNFKWAAAIAAFGMILRDSEYKGKCTMDLVRTLASQSIGQDTYGYRAEFLSLVEAADLFASRD